MHFEKHGRLPNGGRKVVSENFDSQKGVTGTDYIFSIAEELGELVTGFRVEGSLPTAKPIDGFRLLDSSRGRITIRWARSRVAAFFGYHLGQRH